MLDAYRVFFPTGASPKTQNDSPAQDANSAATSYPVIPYADGMPGAANVGVIGPTGWGLREDAPSGRSYVRKDFTLAQVRAGRNVAYIGPRGLRTTAVKRRIG